MCVCFASRCEKDVVGCCAREAAGGEKKERARDASPLSPSLQATSAAITASPPSSTAMACC